MLHAEDPIKKNYRHLRRSPSPPRDSFYLLPVLWGHEVYPVGRNQILQHFGDCDKPGFVRINLDSEEQPAQVDHVLSRAVVTPLQVLGHLLHACTTDVVQ